MIKRIAINGRYGSFKIPNFLKENVNNSNRYYRVVLAELIDGIPDTHSKITQEIYDDFEKNSIEYIKCGNYLYFKDFQEKYPIVNICKIVEVDTSLKWKISNYDGSETIEYFKDPKLVNATLNMWEW